MKRRRFIVGLGGFAAGSGFTLGTGAFTSTSAERQLEVQTAGDNDALLALTERGDGTRSLETGGNPQKVEFSFPGWEERTDDIGLGTNSVYEFDRDNRESKSSDPTEGLLRIKNQGTQTVKVYSEHETDSELDIELYDVSDDSKTALVNAPAVLGVGDSVDVGFRIRTFGVDIGTFKETLTIVAEATDE